MPIAFEILTSEKFASSIGLTVSETYCRNRRLLKLTEAERCVVTVSSIRPVSPCGRFCLRVLDSDDLQNAVNQVIAGLLETGVTQCPRLVQEDDYKSKKFDLKRTMWTIEQTAQKLWNQKLNTRPMVWKHEESVMVHWFWYKRYQENQANLSSTPINLRDVADWNGGDIRQLVQ